MGKRRAGRKRGKKRVADVRAKLERLLSLATSACHSQDPSVLAANEHERASAALMACRIIVEHGMLHQAPEDHVPGDPSPRPRPAPPPPPPRPAPPPPPKAKPREAVGGKARLITTQYDGHCRWCGEDFCVGDRVAWRRGVGAVLASHPECVRWLEQQPARWRYDYDGDGPDDDWWFG